MGRDSAELSSPFENNIQANKKTIPKLANTGSHHAAHEPIVADACKKDTGSSSLAHKEPASCGTDVCQYRFWKGRCPL